MARGKAEDAGGLTPAKDDNAAPYHFAPRTLPIFKCVDYKKTALYADGRKPRCGRKFSMPANKQKDPVRAYIRAGFLESVFTTVEHCLAGLFLAILCRFSLQSVRITAEKLLV